MIGMLAIDYRERRKRLGLWATLAVVGSLLLTSTGISINAIKR